MVMNTKYLVLLALIACDLGTATRAKESAGAPKGTQPNIILVVADDLGYGELGCYGQPTIRTPRIDQLAAEGVRMTDFYCGSPVCAPSRCVLMTGKSPSYAFIRNNGEPKGLEHLRDMHGWEYPGQQPIPADEVTIAELLKSRGYATAAIGKWGLGHFGTTGDPNAQGFDLFFGYNSQWHAHNHYPRFLWRNREKITYAGNDGKSLDGETFSQDEFTREALKFIREHQQKPFFLYLPVAIPHLSIQAPKSSLDWYGDTIPEKTYEHRGYLKHPKPRTGYAAMVTHLDRDVGAIVDLVDELGLSENTLVVFTSDNGPTYDRLGGSDSDFFESTDGLRGRKGSVYEGGIRVPLVARWKNTIPVGRETDFVGAFWDLLPTLCRMAAVEAPEQANGVDLMPALTGQGKTPDRQHLIWEFTGYGGQQAIRMGKWKGVIKNTKKGNRNLELYNLAIDRSEAEDVAEQNPDIVKKLKQTLSSDRTDSPLYPIGPKAAAIP